MEFIIKKQREKFEYYSENVKTPYNKIGDKMLEYSAIISKKNNRRCWVVVLITIISTIALWAVLSWWMIIIWWFICFLAFGRVRLTPEVAFKFEKESDKKGFEKLNDLLGEIEQYDLINGEKSYISYGVDGTFKIEPSVWYSTLDGEFALLNKMDGVSEKVGFKAFFMPGFLFYNNEAIEYTNVEVANTDSWGYSFNETRQEQIIINTWRYTNNDGSKNKVRKNNYKKQIIKTSNLTFTVNNNGKSNNQCIEFSNRELAKKIIEAFKAVFPKINYREIKISDEDLMVRRKVQEEHFS